MLIYFEYAAVPRLPIAAGSGELCRSCNTLLGVITGGVVPA